MKRILVVFDSCRYDSYMAKANMILNPIIGPAIKSYVMCNLTWPTMLMFMCYNRLPYPQNLKDDRFVRTINFIAQLKEQGTKIHFITDNPHLNPILIQIEGILDYFDTYQVFNDTANIFHNANCKKIFDYANKINLGDDFYLVLWLTETHMPYCFDGTKTKGFSIKKISNYNLGIDSYSQKEMGEFHYRQILAAGYLAIQTKTFLSRFSRDVEMIVTSDHGECFGEGHRYGHGIGIGDAVFAVPLAINRPISHKIGV